ncbi:MAG: AhpC/TSA family protein [Deltaproteobacteria bacterium]|nr:AhpC/TSA family protein [Deltaproteobacteria bacterium]
MRHEEAPARDAGGELVVLGSGDARYARRFREDLGWQGRVLSDPGLGAFAAAGMKRSMVDTVLNPRVLGHAVRAFRAGARQGPTQGDSWQLGGVLVVSPTDELVWRYASREAGDHPPPAEVLAALRRAVPPVPPGAPPTA